MQKIIKTWRERAIYAGDAPIPSHSCTAYDNDRDAEISDLRAYIAELEARTPPSPSTALQPAALMVTFTRPGSTVADRAVYWSYDAIPSAWLPPLGTPIPLYAEMPRTAPTEQDEREADAPCPLTDSELADPEYVRGYIGGCLESFNDAMAELAKLRAALKAQPTPAPADQESSKSSGCRMQGGICACRSGGSYGGCVRERESCCSVAPAAPVVAEGITPHVNDLARQYGHCPDLLPGQQAHYNFTVPELHKFAHALLAAHPVAGSPAEPMNGEDGYVCPAGKAQARHAEPMPASEAAKQTDQAHVMPPFAAPASQHDAIPAVLQAVKDALTLLSRNQVGRAWMRSDEAIVRAALGVIADYVEATDKQSDSAGSARQGGNTNEECTLCNGMGYLDGIGSICPHCDGSGKENLAAPAAPTDAQPTSNVEKMLETSQLDELGQEVARLQKALCFWLPSVTDREDEVALRILEDAFLLCGIDGNIPDDFKSAQELGWVTLAANPAAQSVRDALEVISELVESQALKDEYDASPHMHHVAWFKKKLIDYQTRWPVAWARAVAIRALIQSPPSAESSPTIAAEQQQDKLDAARYRWLRAGSNAIYITPGDLAGDGDSEPVPSCISDDIADRAIDIAIAAQPAPQSKTENP